MKGKGGKKSHCSARSKARATSPFSPLCRPRFVVVVVLLPSLLCRSRALDVSALSTPAKELWHAYEALAETNSLATDVATASGINVVSDVAAQTVASRREGGRLDSARTARFATFGLFDGAVSHGWFLGLDAVVGESDGSLAVTVAKVVADALVYTPFFCAWFLSAFVVLEGKSVRTIPSVVREDFWELALGNYGFFLPITGLVYGYVPRDERVLAFGSASLVYTAILSAWNDARASTTTARDGELCLVLDETENECVPVPTPTRPLLSMGMRRAIVRARRASPVKLS